MPRMTNEEAIASLERQLEEAKTKAEEKLAAQLAAVQAKLAEAKAKASTRREATRAKLDEQIAAAIVRVQKAEANLTKLQAERDALNESDEVVESTDETNQDELPEGSESEGEAPSSKRRAKHEAA